jgi:hypothetical protein
MEFMRRRISKEKLFYRGSAACIAFASVGDVAQAVTMCPAACDDITPLMTVVLDTDGHGHCASALVTPSVRTFHGIEVISDSEMPVCY